MDEVRDLARDGYEVVLDGELREDAFERGQLHEGAEVFDGVVGDDLAAVQNDDVRADALHRLKLMRAEEHDLAAACEFFDEAAQDK
jgi:hypothetical protein